MKPGVGGRTADDHQDHAETTHPGPGGIAPSASKLPGQRPRPNIGHPQAADGPATRRSPPPGSGIFREFTHRLGEPGAWVTQQAATWP